MARTRMTEMDKVNLIEKIIQLQERISRATMQSPPDVWMDLSLTVDQLKSLFFIDFEASTNLSQLATALRVTPPTATRIVDRIVKQGLVSREENPENRRMRRLRVTDKGRVVLANLRQSGATRLTSILAQLSLKELAALADGLSVVARATKAQEVGSRDAMMQAEHVELGQRRTKGGEK